MAHDIGKRLEQLRVRRRGTDQLSRLSADAQLNVVAKSLTEEAWQKRATDKPHTRYALGAMQAVDADYTRISLETAERVGQQLDTGLTAAGFSVDFRLQGSVPLDIHIRGVSDVDLLNLDTGFLTYAPFGPLGIAGHYTSPTPKTSLGVLAALRRQAEAILKLKYPAATVDCSGGKAITISGGSLARPVDVVPSHWFDTIAYQASRQEHDRAVTILDKNLPDTIDNWPFLHIKRIHDRDVVLLGTLKKAIRLCKNVKSDAETEGSPIDLSSFDIAAIMYHADQAALTIGAVYELAILREVQRFLDYLHANKAYAQSLRVPDGSRAIFNTPGKLNGLLSLSVEMDELARDVAREQNASLRLVTPNWNQVDETLRKAWVPAA